MKKTKKNDFLKVYDELGKVKKFPTSRPLFHGELAFWKKCNAHCAPAPIGLWEGAIQSISSICFEAYELFVAICTALNRHILEPNKLLQCHLHFKIKRKNNTPYLSKKWKIIQNTTTLPFQKIEGRGILENISKSNSLI